ncbi:hypothetical protein HGA64_04245 [Candidatus Falkowbacteria bacterium]|nr:hypothetical protein [Candidatus Falkowbacteria bacterium]
MDPELQKLIEITTIVKAEDNTNRVIMFGDDLYFSRFQRGQGDQVQLTNLDNFWINKWKYFGLTWSEDLQNFRFLRTSFIFFHYSFEQLRFNKVNCINEFDNDEKSRYFNKLAGLNLCGMYHHGKKCIDLLEELKIINDPDLIFCKKFRETRNKFIEHNFNPNKFKLTTDPFIWSLGSTDSFLKIGINDKNERSYDVSVDYYQDYYNLEEVLVKIISDF